MTPAVLKEQNIAFLKANLSASNEGDNDSEDINNRDTLPRDDLNQLANANQQRQEDAAALQIEEQQQVMVEDRPNTQQQPMTSADAGPSPFKDALLASINSERQM